MSATVGQAADAAAGSIASLPMRKRKKPEDSFGVPKAKVFKANRPSQTPGHDVKTNLSVPPTTVMTKVNEEQVPSTPAWKPKTTKAREIRLEQNRKAARESRRRKKVMIEELQRSVIFFSRANGTLKQQNQELARLLIQAQAQITAVEGGGAETLTEGKQESSCSEDYKDEQEDKEDQEEEQEEEKQQEQQEEQQPLKDKKNENHEEHSAKQEDRDDHHRHEESHREDHNEDATPNQKEGNNQAAEQDQEARAHAVAAQAIYESQGYPAAAARAAAQAMTGGRAGSPNVEDIDDHASSAACDSENKSSQGGLPDMQPGATMQAMANFQQAATAAMRTAMCQMQGIPGMDPTQLAIAQAGTNAQQAYTDAMTALAMQQAAAAAAAASNPFALQPAALPFMHQMLAWQHPVFLQHQLAQQQLRNVANAANAARANNNNS